jgi:hypothetical protein
VISDDSAGRGVFSRRLVLRLDKALPLKARTGRGGRSIEVVLTGQGAALQRAQAAAVASAPGTPPTTTPAPAARADVAPPLAAVPGATAPGDVEAQAIALLTAAREADARQDHAFALARLEELLALPPNAATRAGQALVAEVRLRAGDAPRARAEFETFLKLYPEGPDADAARAALVTLGAAPRRADGARVRAPVSPTSTLSGSISEFYYGGASKVRTQEFQDSPISGLPELASDNTLSGTDQRQLLSSIDLNWRHRDDDSDMRFVFRDAYTSDLLRSDKNRNRLSALYFEHRSLTRGTSVKLGRQSPTGGGVLSRFDGVQAAYAFAPKWKVNAVLGAPTDKLLDARRQFYGAWIDADALTPEISGSMYFNEQRIDGEVDRRALGLELRYFSGGLSASTVLDRDVVTGGLNTASAQATWQSPGNTVVNVMVDRRATPMLMLGNALFFGAQVAAPTDLDPNATRMAVSLKDLLANGYALEGLRQNVKASSTSTTQALLAVNTPVSANWQLGADLRMTQLGALPPIAVILPNGQGRSDNRGGGIQAIATNLYSARDTHVISLSRLSGSGELPDPIKGPTTYGYTGTMLSYNNSSQLNEQWLLEPSLKYYAQTDRAGVKVVRTSPGLRMTWRPLRPLSVETEVSGELAKTTGPTRNETSSRVFYYLGARYDF